jgi:RimJ/RimL family protein N-acetyltransferase
MNLWQPDLKGDLVSLRPLNENDFEELYAAASDPLVWQLHPEPLRYQRPVFQNFYSKALESNGALAVLSRRDGRMMGSSRFYNHQPEAGLVMIGYTFLAREFWGGSYNRELKHLMLSYAFEHVERVHFDVGVTNWRSRRAMEKIGGRLFRDCGADGSTNHVSFEILKSEYRPLV